MIEKLGFTRALLSEERGGTGLGFAAAYPPHARLRLSFGAGAARGGASRHLASRRGGDCNARGRAHARGGRRARARAGRKRCAAFRHARGRAFRAPRGASRGGHPRARKAFGGARRSARRRDRACGKSRGRAARPRALERRACARLRAHRALSRCVAYPWRADARRRDGGRARAGACAGRALCGRAQRNSAGPSEASRPCSTCWPSSPRKRRRRARPRARRSRPRAGRTPCPPSRRRRSAQALAADKGASLAHQVHGALGFTLEHPLHFATRRLWAWRSEYGAERDWALVLGRHAAAQGADGLWPLLARAPGPGPGPGLAKRLRPPRARRSRPTSASAD